MSDRKKSTLTETDVSSRRGIGRRTFLLGAVGGTTALAGCVSSGVTDADVGAWSDAAGYGRGGRPGTGVTDADVGAGADPAGRGRGAQRAGITDADTGRYADPAGYGRRSCTDSDVVNADPVGRGRRC